MKKVILLTLVAFLCLKLISAQPGSLDSSFGDKGIATNHAAKSYYSGMAIQKDGKIVVVGVIDTKNFIGRFNKQGSPDSSFSNDGIIYTRNANVSVAIQSDQKIVVEVSGVGLKRYYSNGKPDTTFGNKGTVVVDFPVHGMTIQQDGKIVVVGSVDFLYPDYYDTDLAIARFNVDGSPDKSFSEDGKETDDFGQFESGSSAVVESDGTIVVGVTTATFRGNGGTLAGIMKNGGVKFSTIITQAGGLTDGGVNAVAVQKDDKIVVIGTKNEEQTLYRYTPGGSLDNEFSGDGQQAIPSQSGSSLSIQDNGKILVGGTGGFQNSGLAIYRYNVNGDFDSTFNENGMQVTKIAKGSGSISSIAIDKDRLYAAGGLTKFSGRTIVGTSGVLARYLLEGKAPPVVTITAPGHDTIYTSPARVKINVAALPINSAITKVEFYNDTILLHTETVFPYGYLWRNLEPGNYTITAKATDNNGFSTTSAAVHFSVVKGVAPTVSMVRPLNNAVFPGPTEIHLKAAANDSDGSISQVQFFVGSQLLGTVTEAPYRLSWRNMRFGSYSVFARATDNMGIVTTSAAVKFTIVQNQPPVVDIVRPLNNQTFAAPGYINIEANASDPIGTIKRVEFYNGDTLLQTQYRYPYTYHWQNLPPGTYTIKAIAIDNNNAPSLPSIVTIRIKPTNTAIVSSRPLTSGAYSKDGSASLKIAPSPATSMLAVYTKGLQEGQQLNLSIISNSGAVMRTAQSNSSVQAFKLDVSTLPGGIYTIKVSSGNRNLYKQFVKL